MERSTRRRIAACKATATSKIRAHGFVTEQVRDFVAAALLVRNTWLSWGPTDDGTEQGLAFEEALMNLNTVLRRFGF